MRDLSRDDVGPLLSNCGSGFVWGAEADSTISLSEVLRVGGAGPKQVIFVTITTVIVTERPLLLEEAT